MNIDPRIEAAARQVAVEQGYPDFLYPDGMADVHAKSYREQAARIIAAADNAATISTYDGLEALPNGSVIIDKHGDVSQRRGDRWCSYETADMLSSQLIKHVPARVIHWGNE